MHFKSGLGFHNIYRKKSTLFYFKIMNTADFHINLEDESNVMEKLAGELQKLALEIRQKIADVAECGEVEREDIRKQLQLRRDEIGKVSLIK